MKLDGRDPQGSILLSLFISNSENKNNNIKMVKFADNTKLHSN